LRERGGEDDIDEIPPAPTASFYFRGARVELSREEFEEAISPLLDRAGAVLDEALRSYARTADVPLDEALMDEVVLVGGASRTPAVQSLLRSRFPPPTPPDLCTSIDPEGAVAQGCAIRAAALSGLVPKHELRNALMLDALPHSMGVRLPDGRFVEILRKDMPLPAMGYATFEMADAEQSGVTVKAVENVGEGGGTGGGEGKDLRDAGEFNFLFRRLTDREKDALGGRRRTVDVGFTVKEDGAFVVSVFDHTDPEHQEKRRRYIASKKRERQAEGKLGAADESESGDKYEASVGEEPKGDTASTAEEALLIVACFIVILLYVGARLAFSEAPDPDEGARLL